MKIIETYMGRESINISENHKNNKNQRKYQRINKHYMNTNKQIMRI